MLRFRTLATLAVAAVLATSCGEGVGASAGTASEGIPFSVVAMAHTFADDSQAWDGSGADGTFTYVAAPCNFDAPVNNNATNLTTLNAQLPGTSSPGSTRMQPLAFEVASSDDDGTGELQGTMTMTVCHTERGPTAEDDPVPDSEKERIVFDFTADYQQVSDEEIVFAGELTIQEGTGTYEGMTGSGELSGYFTCGFRPDDCADLGEFTDLQLVIMGRYQHPDVEQ